MTNIVKFKKKKKINKLRYGCKCGYAIFLINLSGHAECFNCGTVTKLEKVITDIEFIRSPTGEV